MAYEEFSYSIEKIHCNKDIQQYITRIRNGDLSNDAYYGAIDQLAETFRKRDHYTCTDLDIYLIGADGLLLISRQDLRLAIILNFRLYYNQIYFQNS
jgi:hypothetical protein